ncbi:MAG: hypothetical protein U0Q16_18540 [Bryobacteraceae bacterium]
MATMAAYPRPEHQEWGGDDLASVRKLSPEDPEAYRIRPFPNEDVVFWRKIEIDNSRVVRQADPGVAEKCWRFFSIMAIFVVLVVGLLMPNAVALRNSMQKARLETRHQELLKERKLLRVREGELTRQDRLEALARQYGMQDAKPSQVVNLRTPDRNGPVEARQRTGARR